MEYRLQSLRQRYDLSLDDQKVEFLKEAAELLASVDNAVERGVYGARAAEAAGSPRRPCAWRLSGPLTPGPPGRQAAGENRPGSCCQAEAPGKTIRYDNLKSAMAEEGLWDRFLREPALLDRVPLEPEEFSCELLGRVYGLLRSRYREGLQVNLSCLQDLTPEEAAHLAGGGSAAGGTCERGGPGGLRCHHPPGASSGGDHQPGRTAGPPGRPAEKHKPATHAAWKNIYD